MTANDREDRKHDAEDRAASNMLLAANIEVEEKLREQINALRAARRHYEERLHGRRSPRRA